MHTSHPLHHSIVVSSGLNVLCSADAEVARLKRNWMIIHANSFAYGLPFAISYPSLHQFVTTPTDVAASNTVRSYYCTEIIVQLFLFAELINCPSFKVLSLMIFDNDK